MATRFSRILGALFLASVIPSCGGHTLSGAMPPFGPARNFTVGDLPEAAAVGDLDRDGTVDIAVANANSNTVSVLLGFGHGWYEQAVSYSVGTGPGDIAIADFNRDGIP